MKPGEHTVQVQRSAERVRVVHWFDGCRYQATWEGAAALSFPDIELALAVARLARGALVRLDPVPGEPTIFKIKE